MSRENGHSFFPVYTRDKLDGNRSDRKEGERERERKGEESRFIARYFDRFRAASRTSRSSRLVADVTQDPD